MSYILLKSLSGKRAANTGQAASAVVVVALKTESPEIPGQVSSWPSGTADLESKSALGRKKSVKRG